MSDFWIDVGGYDHTGVYFSVAISGVARVEGAEFFEDFVFECEDGACAVFDGEIPFFPGEFRVGRKDSGVDDFMESVVGGGRTFVSHIRNSTFHKLLGHIYYNLVYPKLSSKS